MYRKFDLLGKIGQVVREQSSRFSSTIFSFRNTEVNPMGMGHIRQLSMSNPMQYLLSNGSQAGQIRNLLQPSSKSIIPSSYKILEEAPLSQTKLNAGVFVPARGMKIKGKLKRRCKDCYFIWIEGVKYNLCKTYGRHKQMRKPPYWANLRILTDATQGPKRAW
jgi:large subunit ribosomal protein L36